MEIKAQKSSLMKALSTVVNVTNTKANTLPILGNLLLETNGKESLCIVGTDLEVGISTQMPITVKTEGSITVPSKKLQDIIRELPEGEIEITVAKNNAVNIKAGKSYFKIMGLGKEDYPKLPELNKNHAIEMDQALLKESLSLTSFAISNDETRYVLNGVLCLLEGKTVKFVATDGRRLAFIQKDLPKPLETKLEMIIPIKAVQELLKILSWDGTVQIIPTQNQVIFSVGDTYLVSRLIEGHFPNYQQVIPKDESTQTILDREEFLQAVRRASLLTSIDSPAVKLDFIKGKILISSRSPNLGEAKEELPAEVKGKEVSIGFNPHYLTDVLKNLDAENVSFSLTDPDKPGLLKGKNGYLYVIMPMQLN
ncbi:MAG TPA: DNA polymerase III subunit beta [bacterium]|nr:DNA polymerase III subunit beta [bacterium]